MRVINPTQSFLSDNTRNSQETKIHATGGIRTHSPSKRAVADPRLRERGDWDRLIVLHGPFIFYLSLALVRRTVMNEFRVGLGVRYI